MLAPLFITNSFGWYGNKEGNYSIYFMLDFSFTAIPSEDYCLSLKDKYQTLYDSSSCLIT